MACPKSADMLRVQNFSQVIFATTVGKSAIQVQHERHSCKPSTYGSLLAFCTSRTASHCLCEFFIWSLFFRMFAICCRHMTSMRSLEELNFTSRYPSPSERLTNALADPGLQVLIDSTTCNQKCKALSASFPVPFQAAQ